MKRAEYHSVILSDIHLGTKDSKAEEAVDFLKSIRCRKLILNGDIVDGWALRNGGKWRATHTKFIRTVLKKMEKDDMEIVYLRGNHDDLLERFLPLAFGRLSIKHEYIHHTPQGRYLVLHGDGFDSVTTRCRFVARLGSVGYEILLRINRLYNRWRAWRGKEYFSLSKKIKARVKSAVSFIDRYEEQLLSFAEARHCKGIICGHIHTAADKVVGGIHYLNSGDWVESLTAIVEKEPGEFAVIEYDQWRRARDRDASTLMEAAPQQQSAKPPAVPGKVAASAPVAA